MAQRDDLAAAIKRLQGDEAEAERVAGIVVAHIAAQKQIDADRDAVIGKLNAQVTALTAQVGTLEAGTDLQASVDALNALGKKSEDALLAAETGLNIAAGSPPVTA